MNKIGTQNESTLHSAIKQQYAKPGDFIEVLIDSYTIDIVRQNQLIEIQTGNFSSFKRKLSSLLPTYPIRVIHNIPKEKWIVRKNSRNQQVIGRRKSPKKGRQEEIFSQLIYIVDLIAHPNYSMEVLLTQEEEIWLDDGKGSWRRKGWSIIDRRLLNISERHVYESPQDYMSLLHPSLQSNFTSKDLAKAHTLSPRLAGKMVYCLRKIGVIRIIGKLGNAYLYSRVSSD